MNKLKYYKNLDALRAFAVFAVICCHYFVKNRIGSETLLVKIAAIGNSGVSLFFVLSGFVITRILIQTSNLDNYFKSFYMRRTLRIFPLYYFSLVLYYLIPSLLDGNLFFEISSKQLAYVFYLQNFARTFNWGAVGPEHFWSLSVEEHFYLLWPAIVYFCLKINNKTLLNWSFIIIILVHLLRFFMSYKGYEINVFTFTRLDQLVLGGLLAVYELKAGLLKRDNLYKYIGLIVIGALGILMLELFGSIIIKEVFKHTFFGILYLGVILYVISIKDDSIISQLLQNKFIQFLGKISYGIYVWHMLSIILIDYYFQTDIYIGFILVVLLTIVISWISFNLIELPFLKLKSKFEYNKSIKVS
ncbi:acyltransferase family protein [Flavobacterium sp. LB1P62]|uniref:acyltransferase family protein n=1 Tax=Flavobacterium sp. LB1P62 TaxID=3401715 RepID=UPI003AAE6D04